MDRPATHVPPHDRFCDLVMKGGITSGVVYPRAIAKLAEVYRFKNIGGTSAGAIAAVATAAAEYRRWTQKDDMTGFVELAKLSDELQQPGKLLSLFQPVVGCRRLFRALATALNAKNHLTRAGLILLGLMWGYLLATASSVAVASGVWALSDSLCAAVLAWVMSWLILTALWILHNVSGPVVRAGYGLCSGIEEPPVWWVRQWRRLAGTQPPQALMSWLHALVQRLAGRHVTDDPLTFGDLWEAGGDRFPPSWLAGARPRAIVLQMFTTSVSQGRPYLLPFENEAKPLFYLPSELKQCVPSEIMAFLERKWNRLENKPALPAGADPELRPLPDARDFPIVLAARMSLSFPLLFTAVPLWVEDNCVWPCALRQRDQSSGPSRLRRCWFSDGGIASNFPVHLFDDLLPMWPTFGIQLECVPDELSTQAAESLVWLPENYDKGYEDRWNSFDRKSGYASFSGFLFAIVGTMQNWNDNTLARMPGVRDRVVRLGTVDDEGGMNLDMKPEIVEGLAQRGDAAAKVLIARYGPQADDREWGEAWDDQRWVRLGVLLTLLGKRFEAAGRAIKLEIPYATSYADLIRRANGKSGAAAQADRLMAGMNMRLNDEQAQALCTLLDAMANGERSKPFPSKVPSEPFYAVPEPDLRIRPSL